ncbi:S8 family serine peptidase [Streptomyces sp. ICBB 8177]|uniref:S8 family serine peptidase n=1 Tax=Streptomyces sp. ICBB 8177 TaxID=563922 RepID=UPI001F541DD1|nr:S8 family serine peptidase [Streptomyces sp. ICBB 8177]
MWQHATGAGITVAVIDSGVRTGDPDLTGRLLPGGNVLNSSRDTSDQDGHGTEMAELIAGAGADNGIQGLAPGAKILPVKVGPGNGVGDAAEGLRYAASHGARIANMSLSDGITGPDPQFQSAVNYALSKGVLMFASSGNDGDSKNEDAAPASLPGVVGVGAVGQNLAVTKWSTHGSQVALAAPGDNIPQRCSVKSEQYCQSGGTSSACALASASAALIWSQHPSWTANQVLRVLLSTAGKPTTGRVPSQYVGYGLVRPRVAVIEHQGDPGPANVFPLPGTPDSTPSPSDSGLPSTSSRPIQKAQARADASTGGGSVLPWALGATAAVVVLGGGGAFALRRRKGA